MGSQLSSTHWNELGPSMVVELIDELAIQLLYFIMGSQLSSTHWNELGPSMVVELVEIPK